LERTALEYGRARLEVVQTSPAQMLFEFGRRAAVEGDLDGAASFLRRAVELDADQVQALRDLGNVLHRQEKLAEAISAYGRALELDPEHEDTRFNLALAFLALENRAAAQRQLAWLEERNSSAAEPLRQAIERFGGGGR
jgi:Flp pilus assembly protein TadD